MKTSLLLAGVGMHTSLGASTQATMVALGEGKRRPTATRLVDLGGEPIVGCFALPVSAESEGVRRAVALVEPAIRECMAEAGPFLGATALLLCAPLPWGSFGAALVPAFSEAADVWQAIGETIGRYVEALGCSVPGHLRHLFACGHASGVLALQRAAEILERGDAAQVLIVGLDTRGERATLERLDLLRLVRSRRSPEGFVPGEAAAVLCVRPGVQDADGTRVCGLGLTQESESPSTAKALTAAMEEALAGWGGDPERLGAAAVDLNGQRDRAREWSFAAVRTLYRHRVVPAVICPAERLGDTGAATVPLLAGLLARTRRIASPALLVASSAHGLRGAALLEPRPSAAAVHLAGR